MCTAVEIFRRLSQPIEPIPTGETPQLARLDGIRVVLFDIYGTLLISGSGEVGTASTTADSVLAEAIATVGLETQISPSEILSRLYDTIKATHEELRDAGRDWPEIDIRMMWKRVLSNLAEQAGLEAGAYEGVDVARLAVECETRANPSWPMPGAAECLAELGRHGIVLGIVSNAQFYTLELIEALFGFRAESLGFDPALQFYSYQHGWGKPSRRLFEMAVGELADRGIEPREVVYVGNDMLNDVLAASEVGFHTALFAGDARSLRRREGDPRLEDTVPDLVLTELGQLVECIIEK